MILGLEMKLQFLEEVHGIMENGGHYIFQNGGLPQLQDIHLIPIALFTVKQVSCSSTSVAIHCFGFLEEGEDI